MQSSTVVYGTSQSDSKEPQRRFNSLSVTVALALTRKVPSVDGAWGSSACVKESIWSGESFPSLRSPRWAPRFLHVFPSRPMNIAPAWLDDKRLRPISWTGVGVVPNWYFSLVLEGVFVRSTEKIMTRKSPTDELLTLKNGAHTLQ